MSASPSLVAFMADHLPLRVARVMDALRDTRGSAFFRLLLTIHEGIPYLMY